MNTLANEYTALGTNSTFGGGADCVVLADAELGFVLGGDISEVSGPDDADSANFENSSA